MPIRMEALSQFLERNLSAVYAVYGASFVFLALTVYLQPKDERAFKLARHLWLLGIFSILHAVAEFYELWRYTSAVRPLGVDWTMATLLTLSYLPLVEFARRAVVDSPLANHALVSRLFRAWFYVPLSILLAAFTVSQHPNGAAALSAGARYLLAFPAALITGMALYVSLSGARSAAQSANLRHAGAVLGGGLIAYGVFAGLVVHPVDGLPVWAPTHESFLAATGIPIQVMRALTAVIVGMSLAYVMRVLLRDSHQREGQIAAQLQALAQGLEERVIERTAALEREVAERRRTEAALRASEDRLKEAERLAQMGSWELDLITNRLMWSDEIYRIFELDPDRFGASYQAFLDLVHPEDRSAVNKAYSESVATRAPYEMVHRLQMPDGRIKHVLERGETFYSKNGTPLRSLGTVQDITHRRRTEEALERLVVELRESEQRERELRTVAQHEKRRMAALLSAMSIGILFEDRAGCAEYVNPAFRRMWGIDDSLDLSGRAVMEVLKESSHRLARPDHASKHLLRVLDTHEISERFEIDLYDGRILTQLSYPVTDSEGRILGRLWIYEDITHERQTAQQLLYLAERDPLTGLFNRHRFEQQLEERIQHSRRSGGRFCLLYFDLDEFKYINDTYEHRAGDTVLVRTAGEVSALVRSGEVFARLGGDEFAVLTQLQDNDDIGTLPSRVVRSVSAIPLRFRGTNLRLTASVGIAVFPDHGETAEDLVAHADAAMYQAKAHGKNTWAIYDPNRDLSEVMTERLTWNRRIAQALEENQLVLHFQGIYDPRTWQLSHVEALVRMRDGVDHDHLIMPGQFVPFAEKSGQVKEIDLWVIHRCIALLQAHPQVPGIAVNVSGRTIDEPAVPDAIRTALMEHNVDAGRLVVELTETAAVSDLQDAQRFIEALHKLGCRVCLDDFGTGYSTFAYLKYLGVQILKIDGLFIRDLPNNPDNQAFVKAMVDVARGLGKTIVAEFVEDRQTLTMLHDLGVDLVQGYELDRPSEEHPCFTCPSSRGL